MRHRGVRASRAPVLAAKRTTTERRQKQFALALPARSVVPQLAGRNFHAHAGRVRRPLLPTARCQRGRRRGFYIAYGAAEVAMTGPDAANPGEAGRHFQASLRARLNARQSSATAPRSADNETLPRGECPRPLNCAGIIVGTPGSPPLQE